MLMVSQCGTGFFNSAHFVGAWIKSYNDKHFLLKALFDRKEAILGVYDSKDNAMKALNKMLNRFGKEWRQTTDIYQVGSGEDSGDD